MPHLRCEIEQGLATVVLNNPPQNRLSPRMADELCEIVNVVDRSEARVVLLKAEGPDFSFGGDIVPWPALSPHELRALFERYLSAFNQFERIPIQVASFLINPASAIIMLRHVLAIPRGEWLLQSAAGSELRRVIIRLAKHDGIRTINWYGDAKRFLNWNVWGPTLLLSLPREQLMNKSAGSLVHRASNMLLIRWLGKLEPRCTRRSVKRVEC
jgi:hypothetical protein